MAHIFFEWNALFPAYLHCRRNHAGMDLKRFCTAKDPYFEQSLEIPVRLRPPGCGWFAALSSGLGSGGIGSPEMGRFSAGAIRFELGSNQPLIISPSSCDSALHAQQLAAGCAAAI